MAIILKEKKISTLILIVIVGLLIGSYLNYLLLLIPGENVIKTLFTYDIGVGVGFPSPLVIDLYAIKFQLGLQMKFTPMSILGVLISLYFFRWYK
jgi:hypothetical protein